MIWWLSLAALALIGVIVVVADIGYDSYRWWRRDPFRTGRWR